MFLVKENNQFHLILSFDSMRTGLTDISPCTLGLVSVQMFDETQENATTLHGVILASTQDLSDKYTEAVGIINEIEKLDFEKCQEFYNKFKKEELPVVKMTDVYNLLA